MVAYHVFTLHYSTKSLFYLLLVWIMSEEPCLVNQLETAQWWMAATFRKPHNLGKLLKNSLVQCNLNFCMQKSGQWLQGTPSRVMRAPRKDLVKFVSLMERSWAMWLMARLTSVQCAHGPPMVTTAVVEGLQTSKRQASSWGWRWHTKGLSWFCVAYGKIPSHVTNG